MIAHILRRFVWTFDTIYALFSPLNFSVVIGNCSGQQMMIPLICVIVFVVPCCVVAVIYIYIYILNTEANYTNKDCYKKYLKNY